VCGDELTKRTEGTGQTMDDRGYVRALIDDDRPARTEWCVPPGRSFSLYGPPHTVEWLVVGYLCAYRRFYSRYGTKRNARLNCERTFFQREVWARENVEKHIMSEKSKGRFAVRGWVNAHLTAEDKRRLAEDTLEHSELLRELARWVGDGYRLSVSWDDWSNAVQSTFVCANETDDNFAYGLSARHPDLDLSLQTLLYKATELVVVSWPEAAASPQRETWS
jgi:hypothetical protein